MPETIRQLDVTARDLPRGRVAIEASAGTGKTYSLSVLVSRYVAELGMAPENLLLVTYTNEAARELRTRTREQCREAIRHLRSSSSVPNWMNHMASPPVREQSITYLERFLSRFDELTVSTIHGFCQMVLRRAGASSPAPVDPTVRNENTASVDHVITDLLIEHLITDQTWLCGPGPISSADLRRSLDKLHDCVTLVLENPGCEVWPPSDFEEDPLGPIVIDPAQFQHDESGETSPTQYAKLLASVVRRLVSEIRSRNDRERILTYDDMIRYVAHALDPARSPHAAGSLASSLASQFTTIMVDEFQDTDALQWEIFRSIHAAGGDSSTLITVGDPKQAIYRFRGADVGVYLAATDSADEHYVLGVNWRSDKPLLDGLQRLLTGRSFGPHGAAPFEPVSHAPGRDSTALGVLTRGTTSIPGAPVEIRAIGNHPMLGSTVGDSGRPTLNRAAEVLDFFFSDVAARIVELLGHATLHDADSGVEGRRVTPRDIAVLVNAHKDAEAMVARLSAAGVPAVRLKTGSVLEGEAARQWLMLLDAVAQPGDVTKVRTFGLSWFSDVDEQFLRGHPEAAMRLQMRCAELAALLSRDGIVPFYLSIRNDPSFLTKVLGSDNGERNITDLDHIVEMLAANPDLRRAGPSEICSVFTRLLETPDPEDKEQERRIETDRTAVTVMTRHASKGLQFPIVFLPTLAKTPRRTEPPLMFPRDTGPGELPRRVIDVGSAFRHSKDWAFDAAENSALAGLTTNASRTTACAADIDYEEFRNLYVALTRAQHKVVLYWAPTGRNGNAVFARVLREALGIKKLPTDDAALMSVLNQFGTSSDGSISVVNLSSGSRARAVIPPRDSSAHAPIGIAGCSRPPTSIVASGFGRWSYSGITNRAEGDHGVSTSLQDRVTGDDNAAETAPTAYSWHGIPAGPRFGTAVHRVLDSIDPGTARLEDVVAETRRTFAGWSEPFDVDRLGQLLHATLNHPLGPLLGGMSLRSLGSINRLSELRFDFRLPQDSAFTMAQFVEAIVTGEKTADFPQALRGSLDRFSALGNRDLEFAGFMTGSIDALFRVPGEVPRFVVSDYKTNLMHTESDVNPLRAYKHDRLENEMARHGYFLQSLIYTVALHRYLRWRLPDYDYDRHVGGVSYLFLRGLGTEVRGEVGESHPCGVYEWLPPRASVEALDRLFAGERR